MTRRFLVRLHRYAGLGLALFLIVAGLSGAIIAFEDEWDAALNPELLRTDRTGPYGSPFDFIDKIERDDPRGRVTFATLRFQEGRTALYFVKPRIDAATKRPYRLGYNQVFVDPTTGEIRGKRHWGAFAWDREHLLPAIYEIHYSLFLPEMMGAWFLGCVAFVWFVDCFVGAALTLRRRQAGIAGWARAWKIKPGGVYRWTFDIHRATGLWLWAVLIVMSFSGFYLRVGDDVVRPLLLRVSSLTPTPFDVREHRDGDDTAHAPVGYRGVVDKAVEARDRLGWSDPPSAAVYDPEHDVYAVGFQSPQFAGRKVGAPTVYLDGESGDVLGDSYPLRGTVVDVMATLPRALHGGKVAGLPGRILVALAGVATAVLSITGVAIWWRKRRGRGRGRPAEG